MEFYVFENSKAPNLVDSHSYPAVDIISMTFVVVMIGIFFLKSVKPPKF